MNRAVYALFREVRNQIHKCLGFTVRWATAFIVENDYVQ